MGQSMIGVHRGHNHPRPGKGQPLQVEEPLSLSKRWSPLQRGLSANFTVSFDQGWDDVGDASKAYIGGSPDRTRCVPSGQLLAWHSGNPGNLPHVWRLSRGRLGAHPRKKEAYIWPSSLRRPSFPRECEGSRRDAPERRGLDNYWGEGCRNQTTPRQG